MCKNKGRKYKRGKYQFVYLYYLFCYVQVLLVGGTTRIKCFENMLVSEFREFKHPRNKINKSLNREEPIVKGAAIYAAIKSNNIEVYICRHVKK